jgi:plastocyanin
VTTRSLATLSFLVLADAWCPVQAQQPAAPGRIEGVATISRRLTTARPRVRIYSEPGTPPAAPAADENRFANVVLYLEADAPIAASARSAAPAPVMRQQGERFEPHVLPVLVGTTVTFPNDDPIYHNVFSLSRARSFDLGRYPRGSSKSVRFTTPGVVQVFCHIHADMSGYILVLENPFFVVPGADGRFALDGVPPGDYRLIAWNERIRPVSTPVHVEAGRTAELRVAIPLPEEPGTP